MEKKKKLLKYILITWSFIYALIITCNSTFIFKFNLTFENVLASILICGALNGLILHYAPMCLFSICYAMACQPKGLTRKESVCSTEFDDVFELIPRLAFFTNIIFAIMQAMGFAYIWSPVFG